MAEDFGDDAGQQLYEWTMRIGLYASGRPGAGSSQEQVQRAVDRLTAALEHARDMAPDAAGHEASLPEYAKLDLHDLLHGLVRIYGAVRQRLAQLVELRLADLNALHAQRFE